MSDLYKVLVDGRSCHGGRMAWSLPSEDGNGGWTPGDWHEVAGPVEVCKNGLHLTAEPVHWLRFGCEVYAAEGAGGRESVGDKVAFGRARLLRPEPDAIPDWWRAVERFVREDIPAVPWFDPQGEPDPAWVVRDRTRDEARGAGWDAARDAAWDAARDAARDAAWDAARDAAWDAAWGAAWDAARPAARDAARDAARPAARDAALYAAVVIVCDGLPIDPAHVARATARWDAWKRGYAVLRDVDGVLHVWDPKEARA